MKRAEHRRGTIKIVRGRDGEITGYQPLLPRHLSRAPTGVLHPEKYREPLGPPLATAEEARRLLDAAIVELRSGRFEPKYGLPLSAYVHQAIAARRTAELRQHKVAVRADRAVSTWRSVDRNWLSEASFYEYPPAAVDTTTLQNWFNVLRDEGISRRGDPISPSFMRHISGLLAAAFDRAKVLPNPMLGVELPSKTKPRVEYLDFEAQRRFYGSEVELADRVMVGCGMGAGLRVNELLSMEASDVHLDSSDPYLFVQYGGPHHAPTKGRRPRRVELFEPGLGFWRLWLEKFYQGTVRVFDGERGGYLKAWPEQFSGWAKHAGVRVMTSHVMRHSYAVAMLSGSWGYEPAGLEFVCKQLGHSSQQTTEKYYGAFEAGTWTREVRRMTGRSRWEQERSRVTAAELLGLFQHAQTGVTSSGGNGQKGQSPLSTQSPILSLVSAQKCSERNQLTVAECDQVLALAAAGKPEAWPRMTDLIGRIRDQLLETEQEADSA